MKGGRGLLFQGQLYTLLRRGVSTALALIFQPAALGEGSSASAGAIAQGLPEMMQNETGLILTGITTP